MACARGKKSGHHQNRSDSSSEDHEPLYQVNLRSFSADYSGERMDIHCVRGMSPLCVHGGVTIDYAVFGPHDVSVRLHLLVVWELQVNGEGHFGSSQSWWIVLYIEGHFSACKRTQKKTFTFTFIDPYIKFVFFVCLSSVTFFLLPLPHKSAKNKDVQR